MLAYIAWAIAENDKPCSAYYHSLDTTKIATNGFSCGGLMAEGTAGDPRITTWGFKSSGLFSADQALYKTVHTRVLIVLGGSEDIAYTNGERDYDNISALGMPIMLFSKALGHGGDLFKGGVRLRLRESSPKRVQLYFVIEHALHCLRRRPCCRRLPVDGSRGRRAVEPV